jgi:hypothetical protein
LRSLHLSPRTIMGRRLLVGVDLLPVQASVGFVNATVAI